MILRTLSAALIGAALLASPARAATPAPVTPAATAAAATPSKPAKAPNYAELYKKAQQKLTDAGLYKGAVDGVRTPDYVGALKKFQESKNIKPTGRLTRETRSALGI